MIELITDSTSDIPKEVAEQLNIRVLPLSVFFGEEGFLDGVDISNHEFYQRLRQAEALPTTSQINPETFVELFQQVLERGNQAVCIFISSELSGTCQSAMVAKQIVGSDEIFVVDSRTVTVPFGLLVTEAARIRDTGCTAAELAEQVTQLRERVRLRAVLDTLKYLKMGGRISAATAMVGGVLGITPIVAVQDGIVQSIGKTRGRKAGIQWIYDAVTKERIDLSRAVAFGHTDCPEAMEQMEQAFAQEATQAPGVYRWEIGSVVGTHAGPGATGIAYFAAE